MKTIKLTVVALALVLGLSVLNKTQAQATMTQVESLYIYNFIKNIQWSNVADKYVVGVYANDETFDGFNKILAVRKFNGKSIEIKKLSSPEQASECHVVFVDQSNGSMVKKITTAADTKNTLIVSERGQLNNGAGIAFVLVNSKLQFKINEEVCKASGLQISASLLSLGV
ncbi:MAG: YfiR family protein [Cyclobacteriaceae bacterium]|nr:YfiR family protein [Cyclobacteriaceae bacterium]